MSARVKLPPPLDKLLRSQFEKAIYESDLDQDPLQTSLLGTMGLP